MSALTALPTLVQTESYAPMRSSSSIIQKKSKSAKYGRMHYSKLKVFRLIGRNKIHDGREGGVCVCSTMEKVRLRTLTQIPERAV